MPPHGLVSVSLNCTVEDRASVATIGAKMGLLTTSDTLRAALNLLAERAGVAYTFASPEKRPHPHFAAAASTPTAPDPQ